MSQGALGGLWGATGLLRALRLRGEQEQRGVATWDSSAWTFAGVSQQRFSRAVAGPGHRTGLGMIARDGVVRVVRALAWVS